ncbi:hypothetical protein [Propionibacterium sp. oral taxon 192]|nr:hypothetical protein [Propionibacterium sp. oral taxon 192]
MLVIPITIIHGKDIALTFSGLRIRSVPTRDAVAESENVSILFWD